ncbi:MAG: succinate dehydrogenase/fumarate reductase flavoprotein subunit, partial [Lentimonas sp.]
MTSSINHNFEVIIIGSGGAGLMAALSCASQGIKNVAVISKVFPTSSHTVAAKGGINAALGNVSDDNYSWHCFDTIKGSDYLADHDAVEFMCKQAPQTIIDLENMGVVFSRNDAGKIDQRAYGGQKTNFGKGVLAHRACFSKDRTGHTILQTLYQQCLQKGVKFFNEFFVTDLLMSENNNREASGILHCVKNKKQCFGALAIDLESGKLNIFKSKITILATGGYGQIYRHNTSSDICTGDGNALILKENLELQDMEFIQFHPTSLYGSGLLIS